MLIIRAKRASYRLREVIIQSETINAPNRRKLVFVRIGAFFIDGGDLRGACRLSFNRRIFLP